jgi:hypothetical protein
VGFLNGPLGGVIPHVCGNKNYYFKISRNPHSNANHEQCSNAAFMRPCSPRLTELTCMNWRVLVIEKHPPVCRESFWGPSFGNHCHRWTPEIWPNFKIHPQKNEHFTPIFLVEHELSFSFNLGSSNTFLACFLIIRILKPT